MIEYKPPEVKESINKIEYAWRQMDLLVSAERLTNDGKAELWFWHVNKTGNSLIDIAYVNLLAPQSMKSLANNLEANSEDIPWQQLLTYVKKTTLDWQRRGEPERIVVPAGAEIERPTYYIEPVIMQGVPNVIRGDKGVNKTILSLMMMCILGVGYRDSPSGLIAVEPARVGMLDYESNYDLTRFNISRLVNGEACPYYEMPYLKMKRPLADDSDRVYNFVSKHNLDVVLIDSLGKAAGSERFDSSGKVAADRFFEVHDQMNITSLIIAQHSKGIESGKDSIYGSTFFTYYSRNIFLLKDTNTSIDKDIKVVALLHRDSNYSRLYDTLGYRLTFSDDSIGVASEEVHLSQLLDRVNQTKTLLEFLRHGAKSAKEIAQELEVTDNRARVLLSQLKKRGKILNPASGQWALVSDIDDTQASF